MRAICLLAIVVGLLLPLSEAAPSASTCVGSDPCYRLS